MFDIINQTVPCLLQILSFHRVESAPFSWPKASGVAGTWGADIWASVSSGSVHDYASWNAAQPYQRDPCPAQSRDPHAWYRVSTPCDHSKLMNWKVLNPESFLFWLSYRLWCAVWLCVSHPAESRPAGKKHPGSFSCRSDQWNNGVWRGCCTGTWFLGVLLLQHPCNKQDLSN